MDRLEEIFEARGQLHMIGIGGAGMRGLGAILDSEGITVTGCDRSQVRCREVRNAIPELSDRVSVGHEESHVSDLLSQEEPVGVIRSEAISEDHPEVKMARHEDVPVFSYPEGLAFLCNRKQGVAVAGTHGKTTCASLLAEILEGAGRDPTCLIGGELKRWNSNARVGSGDLFLAEACEFHENFSALAPQHILLTNVDVDHLDYYKGPEHVEEAFGRFLSSGAGTGVTVWNAADPRSKRVIEQASGKALAVSREGEQDWLLREVEEPPDRTITVQQAGDVSPPLPVPLPGDHQVMNAAQVAVMARVLGVDWEFIQSGLQAYQGVRRRFDVVQTSPFVVIDDYGHHPEEVSMTIQSVRERYPDRPLTVCFQPHQYSRTYQFLDRWGASLREADVVWLVSIYEARDTADSRGKVSIEDVAETVRQVKGETGVSVFEAPEEAGKRFAEEAETGEVFLTLGAGDVWKAAQEAVEGD